MVRLDGAKAKAKVTSLLSQVPSGGDGDGYVQGVGMFKGTLLAADILVVVTDAGGTHPTGMLSCLRV